jgi:glyoxylate/hydroxypyruvate reductase A
VSLLFVAPGWDEGPWRKRFAALLPGHTLVTPETLVDRAAVRYAIAWRPPHGLLAELPQLEAIFSLGAGVDAILADPNLPDAPIARIVDPDLTARMSEWVVLHCLMHLRQARRYERQQRERIWDDDDDQPAAADVRIGILGLGELGRDAAGKLAALGFRVAAWSASAKIVTGIACFNGTAGLDAMLARSDILVCLLPLTATTRGIVNAALFAKLPRDGRLGGPILLNAGRGGLQVEADILAALDSGALKGASLDVFETEPLPQASLLWGHPAVFVTPHNAAISHPDSVARAIAEQILAHERGEPLRHLVDRGRGY